MAKFVWLNWGRLDPTTESTNALKGSARGSEWVYRIERTKLTVVLWTKTTCCWPGSRPTFLITGTIWFFKKKFNIWTNLRKTSSGTNINVNEFPVTRRLCLCENHDQHTSRVYYAKNSQTENAEEPHSALTINAHVMRVAISCCVRIRSTFENGKFTHQYQKW